MDLTFKTISHFRELGGLRTVSGKTIRHGYFYRCGALSHVSEEEKEKLAALNISKVFDLRRKKEAENDPDFKGDFEYYLLPAMPDVVRMEKEFEDTRSYADMLLSLDEGGLNFFIFWFARGYMDIPFQKQCVAPILKSLDDHKPILLHCFAGKDRTGVLSMIISAALGCDYETCKADYMRHNEIAREEREAYLAALEAKQVSPWGIKAFDMANSAVEAWFDCAWYSILGTWSTIDRFLSAEYGITPEQLADWREFYLE